MPTNPSSTFLFITHARYRPQAVDARHGGTWSCSKATSAGDTVLVYVAGAGLSYVWTVTSDATPHDEWRYVCGVRRVRALDPPISLPDLKEYVPEREWQPPHQNFRGYRSILVPPLVARRLLSVRRRSPKSLQILDADLARQIEESIASSAAERRRRLADAPRKPTAVRVMTIAYIRNPDVVAEVLLRAKGRCEACGKRAPFRRASDQTPYLEVHHKVRLSDGGEDTTRNAVALCPNCHRKAHFG